MKIHRYDVNAVEGPMNHIHGGGRTQHRLYFPGRAVIGYGFGNPGEMDFF